MTHTTQQWKALCKKLSTFTSWASLDTRFSTECCCLTPWYCFQVAK